jgi:hypothetical protein
VKGNKIAIINNNGQLVARDGIYGSWIVESNSFGRYWLTQYGLVAEIGSYVYYKTDLSNSWVQLTPNMLQNDGQQSSGIYPGGNIIYQTQNLSIAQNGSNLYACYNYQWVQLTDSYAYGLQVQGGRIAIINTSGYLVAKSDEGTNFDEYWLSQSLLVERIGSCLYYKTDLAATSWTLLTGKATPGTVTVNDNVISYTNNG